MPLQICCMTRPGIEPRSTAKKASFLPLGQGCGYEIKAPAKKDAKREAKEPNHTTRIAIRRNATEGTYAFDVT